MKSNHIFFMNESEFDTTAMLTFGVSAKDSNDAIGFFGTGFKYAVAIILRLGGSIKITSHGQEYVFEKRHEIIRGQIFDVVYMNGQNAGFTTHLGINWEPWMAFRELYSNCVDENGAVSDEHQDSGTVIDVACFEVAQAFMEKDKYFIQGTPTHFGQWVDIYAKGSSYIFYKGVAVGAIDSAFSFNVKTPVRLSEERTVKHTWEVFDPIAKEIQKITDPELIRSLLLSRCDSDKRIPYHFDYKTSDEFISTAKTLLITNHGLPESARAVVKRLDEKRGEFPLLELTDTQKIMMDRAKRFLMALDIDINEFPVKTVKGLGEDVMGRAINGEIYLSAMPFQLGTKQVASTLLEAWVHCKHKCQDFDRVMQNWLFDKILSVGEELRGEPL